MDVLEEGPEFSNKEGKTQTGENMGRECRGPVSNVSERHCLHAWKLKNDVEGSKKKKGFSPLFSILAQGLGLRRRFLLLLNPWLLPTALSP